MFALRASIAYALLSLHSIGVPWWKSLELYLTVRFNGLKLLARGLNPWWVDTIDEIIYSKASTTPKT